MGEKKLTGALTLVLALAAMLVPGTTGATATAAEGTPEPAPHYFTSDGQDTAQALRNLVELNAIPSRDTGWVPSTNPPITDDKACPASRCRDYTLPRPAGVSVTRPVVRVLLPVGYSTETARRYPVVYLFNGSLSPYVRWTRQTMLTSMSRSMKAIFVMPEGGHGGNAGYFTDWKDGSFDWETWHVDHLVPWVDRRFRTVKGARAAVGASMGAQGALTYAARHPGLFKAVLSISGLVNTSSLVQNTVSPSLNEALGASGPDLRRIWGDPVLDAATWNEHNPVQLVPQLKDVSLFIAAGTGHPQYDPDDAVHSGTTEQSLWNYHRYFFTRLTQEGVPYQARISVGQYHDWPYFDGAMRWGLPRVIAAARR